MKKFFIVALTLILCATLCGCALTNEDGSSTIAGVAIEQGLGILTKLLETAILIAGTWLLGKIGTRQEFANSTVAIQTLLEITRQTVGELNQVFVDEWKKAGDGKLTPEEVNTLQQELLRLVKAKLTTPVQDLIEAAGADINALIIGEAESYIHELKNRTLQEIIFPAGTAETSDEGTSLEPGPDPLLEP